MSVMDQAGGKLAQPLLTLTNLDKLLGPLSVVTSKLMPERNDHVELARDKEVVQTTRTRTRMTPACSMGRSRRPHPAYALCLLPGVAHVGGAQQRDDGQAW